MFKPHNISFTKSLKTPFYSPYWNVNIKLFLQENDFYKKKSEKITALDLTVS